jgi:hypothetical protein
MKNGVENQQVAAYDSFAILRPSYLTQLRLYREDMEFVTRTRHVIWQIVAFGCGLLSLVAFAVGSGFAAFRFQ